MGGEEVHIGLGKGAPREENPHLITRGPEGGDILHLRIRTRGISGGGSGGGRGITTAGG